MNFLKKKLKPLTSGLTTSTSSNKNHNKKNHEQDLESDLYDDYVVEAPPHPSELLALGVDPTDIDVNDPDKLRELYRKVKEEAKDKKVNSVLLAKQRQKEEVEEKKKTAEEWKFFDSLTARVEEAVKNSQKTLEHLKESSAIDKLNEPEYELRSYTPEQLAKVGRFNITQQEQEQRSVEEEQQEVKATKPIVEVDDTDPFGFGLTSTSGKEIAENNNSNNPTIETTKQEPTEQQQHIVEELFEDLGIDLRPSDQRTHDLSPARSKESTSKKASKSPALDDPFDTSFVETVLEKPALIQETLESRLEAKYSDVDPFDTSFVNL